MTAATASGYGPPAVTRPGKRVLAWRALVALWVAAGVGLAFTWASLERMPDPGWVLYELPADEDDVTWAVAVLDELGLTMERGYEINRSTYRNLPKTNVRTHWGDRLPVNPPPRGFAGFLHTHRYGHFGRGRGSNGSRHWARTDRLVIPHRALAIAAVVYLVLPVGLRRFREAFLWWLALPLGLFGVRLPPHPAPAGFPVATSDQARPAGGLGGEGRTEVARPG